MTYHNIVRVRERNPEEEYGPDYLDDTIAHFEDKARKAGMKLDDPELDLIRSEDFAHLLDDVLSHKENRELIEGMALNPSDVLGYIGMVANAGMFDLYTYDGISQYHKHLFSEEN